MARPIISLVGRRFGKLLVEAYGGAKNKRPFWMCRCDCGANINVLGGNLKSGNTCGCGDCDDPISELVEVWDKFGWLTIVKIDKDARDKQKRILVDCACACGNPNIISYRRRDLIVGNKINCGLCDNFKPPIKVIESSKNDFDRIKPKDVRTLGVHIIRDITTKEIIWSDSIFGQVKKIPVHYHLQRYDTVWDGKFVGTLLEERGPDMWKVKEQNGVTVFLCSTIDLLLIGRAGLK